MRYRLVACEDSTEEARVKGQSAVGLCLLGLQELWQWMWLGTWAKSSNT